MTTVNPIPKVSIFIDYSNIFIAGRRCYGINVDPIKLSSILSKGKQLVHTYLFSSENPENKGEMNFYRAIKMKGIIVETERLVERPVKIYCRDCKEPIDLTLICSNCGNEYSFPPHKSKRVDVLLTTVILNSCNTYDEAILVGGDQDFIPVIRVLRKEKGKKVFIASFENPLSSELEPEVDGITILDDIKDKIAYIKQ